MSDHTAINVATRHPLILGQQLNRGTVVAWGYYDDDWLAVLTLLNADRRVPNHTNYELFLYDYKTGAAKDFSHFPNIVPAVESYAEDYGMDY